MVVEDLSGGRIHFSDPAANGGKWSMSHANYNRAKHVFLIRPIKISGTI